MGDAPADGMVLKVGGVPEHFNAPWHLTIGEMKAAGEGPAVEWTTVHGGTGAMASMLKSGELDAAMMLTEGAVAAITKEGGEGLCIWGQYVASPLTWGIHTGSKNAGRFKTADDLKGSVIAISRFGSGSHLMAYVDAQQRGWDTSALKFEVVGSLEGSRKALAEGGSAGDVWLWEKVRYINNEICLTDPRTHEEGKRCTIDPTRARFGRRAFRFICFQTD